MATTRTSSAGKVSFGSWESEKREHPQGCSLFARPQGAEILQPERAAFLFLPHCAGVRIKGDILFLEREFFLFRTGANVNAAQVPRDATPIFFPEKENGRRPSKRKAFPIASEQLEELQCLPIATSCARRCRV